MTEFESLIEKKCQQLLERAFHYEASDIHFVPAEKNYQLYFRKYNQREAIENLPFDLGERLISYFKFLSALDISEKRKPQSGAFQQQLEGRRFAFRISTLPSVYAKESLVVRLLRQDYTAPVTTLSYFTKSGEQLLQLMQQRQGIILFTGATGSGKTTSLYSLIYHSANTLKRHVISLEDPVENSQSEVLQIQVNERAGVTYSTGLKAILRHSPDVIMIGEIRDKETAAIAIEAALTGHLVVTTIHAKDAVSCLYRLQDLHIPLADLQQTILAIVAQQLVTTPNNSRRAIYEILQGEYLQRAFNAMQRGEYFSMPEPLTLAGQQYLMRSDERL